MAKSNAIADALRTAQDVNATGTAPAPRREEPNGNIAQAPKKAAENEPEPLFDYSRLSEVPKVPQFDLKRNEPARGVTERVQDLMKNKLVRGRMLKTLKEGLDLGGANWYNTDPLRDEFMKVLGKDHGDAAHRRYMEYVAATSPRSEVGTNARNASYYFHRERSGAGVPEVGEQNPQPYGHMAQRLHQQNAQNVVAGGWDSTVNPKVASFVENLHGNQQPATIDTHAFRLPAIHAKDPRFLNAAFRKDQDSPPENIRSAVESGAMKMKDVRPAHWLSQPNAANEYGAMERYYQGLAKELGITPAQAQAAAWVGGGKLTGLASDESKPFLRFFQDRIYKTAHETGMEPRDVMRAFIKGDIPLRKRGGEVGNGVQHRTGAYAEGGTVENPAGAGLGVGQEGTGAGAAEAFARGRYDRDAAVSSTLAPLFQGNVPATYTRTVGRVGPHDVAAVHRPTPKAQAAFKQAGLSLPELHERQPGAEAAREFHSAISAAKASHANGAAVHAHDPQDCAGMRTFMTPDKGAGFALKGDDIVSLFKHRKAPYKDVADALLHAAVQNGGRRLDAFDTVLPHIYGRNRFKATSRMPWNDDYRPEGWDEKQFAPFNGGRPDVVHMAYAPQHGKLYHPSHGERTTDYDRALELQEAALRPKRADGGQLDAPQRRLTPQGLYSQAGEAAAALPQQKGTMQQFGAALQKKGVKPAELANSGFDFSDSKLLADRDNLAKHFAQKLPPIRETEYWDPARATPSKGFEYSSKGRPTWQHPRSGFTVPGAGPAQYSGYSMPEGKNHRELLLHAPMNRDPDKNYTSTHWPVKNVLAHLRMTDRELPPEGDTWADRVEQRGKTFLHLDELQSDWGQQARSEGMRGEPIRPDWYETLQNMRQDRGSQPFADPEQEAYFQKLHKHEWAVPHHPYVANTNAWVDLGLKRALLEAAKGGHEYMAWTPGEEQAKRYGMRNYFSSLHYRPPGEGDAGKGELFGHVVGEGTPHKWRVEPDKLHQAIGTDLAGRLLATEPRPIAWRGADYHQLNARRDGDLVHGGEGHMHFYDKMVPQRLKEIVKKLGHEAEFGHIPHTVYDRDPDTLGEDEEDEGRDINLHSLKLTPELRESILKGMPAFAHGGDVQEHVIHRAAGGKTGAYLRPAMRHEGKLYYGASHIDAVLGMPKEHQRDALASEGNFGFVNHKGHFLDRKRAQQYAVDHGLIRDDAPQWAHGAPEAVSEHLKPPPDGYADGGKITLRAAGVMLRDPEDRILFVKRAAKEGDHGGEWAFPGGKIEHGESPAEAATRETHEEIGHRIAGKLGEHADRRVSKDGVEFTTFEHRVPKQFTPKLNEEHTEHCWAHPNSAPNPLHPGAKATLAKLHDDNVVEKALRITARPAKKRAEGGQVAHEPLHKRSGMGRAYELALSEHPHYKNAVFGAYQEQEPELVQAAGARSYDDLRSAAFHHLRKGLDTPLAAVARFSDTVGKHAYENSTPLNAEILSKKHELEGEAAMHRRFGRDSRFAETLAQRDELMKHWKHAPDKDVLLPPEMLRPDYAGGLPEHTQKLSRPAPGTGMSSQITHFSHRPDLTELDPSHYGSGIAGDERLRLTKRPGAVYPRAYGYLDRPGGVIPEEGLGGHAYRGQLHDLYDMSKDPMKLGLLAAEANRKNPLGNFNPGTVDNDQAMNDTERMAKEYGYSGVANPNAAFPMMASFGKVPVKPDSLMD